MICDFGVTSLNVPCVSCSTMPLKPINEGFLARLTIPGRACQYRPRKGLQRKRERTGKHAADEFGFDQLCLEVDHVELGLAILSSVFGARRIGRQ